MKKILITGKNSYIGTSFETWLSKEPDNYQVDTIDMKDGSWKQHDFSQYDAVFHVAGIAHIEETKENRDLYFEVNRDLAYNVAKKAKEDGSKQFIFLSSMSVYGLETGVITRETKPSPKSAYGQSKYEAENLIKELEDDKFKIAILRPPMVYGKNSKGNYQLLSKFAKKSPIFPNIENKRSMLYIDNLSEFVKELINTESSGLFFPQNKDYVCTSNMVKQIAKENGKKIKLVHFFNPLISMFKKVSVIQKVFGDLLYDESTRNFVSLEVKFKDSVRCTEKQKEKLVWFFHHYATPPSLNGFTRPYYFSKELAKQGYETKIFTSSYLHFADKQLINKRARYEEHSYEDVDFVFVKTSSGNRGVKRVLNMLSYYFNLKKTATKLIKSGQVPDVLIASSPHPLALLAGIRLSKKTGIPVLTEIRDFWPEVFFVNEVLSETSFLGKLLLKGEKWIYEKSDSLIFLKEGDFEYIIDKKWDVESGGKIHLDKIHYINNGINLAEFDQYVLNNKLEDPDLDSDKFKVVYTGSIRPVNDVKLIVETARLLKDNDDILFLVYGEGSQEDELKSLANEFGLENIKFKGYVDKKYVPFILSKSSINLLNYSQDKYNWSRGNSSNKLFEYMASGKPVLATMTMGYSPLVKYNCGSSIEMYSSESLKNEIEYYQALDKNTLDLLGNNARKGVVDFDFFYLTENLISVLEAIK